MLYLVGIIITFFLAIILAGKKGKTTADFILIGWLTVMGIHLLEFYLFVTHRNILFPHLLGLELPLPLLHGPFLFLYTLAVTQQSVFKKAWLMHFLPFIFIYVSLVPFFLLPADQKIIVYEAEGKGYETLLTINVSMIILSGVSYFFLSLRVLYKHKQFLQNQFSSTEKISLSWLRYLIYGIGLIWLSVIFGNENTTFGITVVFVIFIGYFGINQVGIFTQKIVVESKPTPEESSTTVVQQTESSSETSTHSPLVVDQSAEELPKVKYQKSSLNEEAARTMHLALTQLMNEQKLFTNPELTLAELAQALNVHPNNLSQVINTLEQKSFYDYINIKRVEEFKRRVALPENQRFTLLGLAHNCGFNSKTSFNRNFKNNTGLSPSEYLKQANILIEQ